MAIFKMRLNEQDDKSILDWLAAQEDKTKAVKAAIRMAMEQKQDAPCSLDLASIRNVMESVLDERLANLAMEQQTQEKDKALEDKLDDMF